MQCAFTTAAVTVATNAAAATTNVSATSREQKHGDWNWEGGTKNSDNQRWGVYRKRKRCVYLIE